MIEKRFYNKSTRRYVLTFGSLFNGMTISGNNDESIDVPLTFSTKEKFIQKALHLTGGNPDPDTVIIKETLPRMGFEFTGLQYDSNRKTNTIEKFKNNSQMMFNRVPYDFQFRLYITTRKLDDSLKIIEQIVPWFTPSLSVQITDMEILDEPTTIDINLDGITPEIDADGEFIESRRFIMWTLDFTLKGYFYSDTKTISLIKKNIIDFIDMDSNEHLENIFQYVDPLSASEEDSHEIITEISDTDYESHVATGSGGSTATTDL